MQGERWTGADQSWHCNIQRDDRAPAQVGVLHDVFGGPHLAEHAVGQGLKAVAVLFEGVCVGVGHGAWGSGMGRRRGHVRRVYLEKESATVHSHDDTWRGSM